MYNSIFLFQITFACRCWACRQTGTLLQILTLYTLKSPPLLSSQKASSFRKLPSCRSDSGAESWETYKTKAGPFLTVCCAGTLIFSLHTCWFTLPSNLMGMEACGYTWPPIYREQWASSRAKTGGQVHNSWDQRNKTLHSSARPWYQLQGGWARKI